jgi:hypothetical protein
MGRYRTTWYRVIDDFIFYKDRVYLVPGSGLKKKILAAVHDSPLAGHQGFFKTYRKVRERFSWKGLKQDVMRHISECVTCQQNKSKQTLPAGLLQPLPIPEQKWESLSMDFITGLPKAQGKDDIFVGVDRLTKFARFLAIPTDYNAVQVAELFFRETFRLHGLPQSRLSDRDSRFINTFWQEVFRLVGTKLTPNTSYHPQTDGQTEIVNKWVEGYLRNYMSGQQRAWVRWLHLGEHCYDTTFPISIGMTPFRALYGYDAPTLVDLIFGDNRIHNVFHVSCLKKTVGQFISTSEELPPLDEEGQLELVPEEVLEFREQEVEEQGHQGVCGQMEGASSRGCYWGE